jgi:predicted nucleic acid-binding protein
MILLDTSAWIKYLNYQKLTFEQLQQVATCPPVIQEVLQRVKPAKEHERLKLGLLALPCVGNPIGTDIFLEAAEIYRVGRSKGFTIRSTVDCLIAAIAISHNLPVHHFDRDYHAIAKFTKLRITAF